MQSIHRRPPGTDPNLRRGNRRRGQTPNKRSQPEPQTPVSDGDRPQTNALNRATASAPRGQTPISAPGDRPQSQTGTDPSVSVQERSTGDRPQTNANPGQTPVSDGDRPLRLCPGTHRLGDRPQNNRSRPSHRLWGHASGDRLWGQTPISART